MCTFNEDGITEMININKKEITQSDLCRKCQANNATIILRENDLYCNSCFSIYFVHKFRSTIGKSKQIKPGDRVLIGLSGGLSSSALLHLISHGLNESAPKKLRFDPYVIFIDESRVNSSVPSINTICNEVLKLKFPLYFASLEQIVKKGDSELSISTVEKPEDIPNGEERVNAGRGLGCELEELLSLRLKSATSRGDLLFHLRNELLCRCAKQLGFKKVFLGTNASELSVRILSDIALGRGSQLADHVQFKSTQFGVQLFRPMRELLYDEILCYVKCHHIPVPSFGADREEINSNIVSCTRSFVSDLQREFLSTIPTIFRTGSKLVNGTFSSSESTPSRASDALSATTDGSTKTPEIGEEDVCLFCGLGKDSVNDPVSALAALKFSKKLSASHPPDLCANEAQAIDGRCSVVAPCKAQEGTLQDEEIHKYFCYGCGNLFQEMGNTDHFPARVQEKLSQKKREEETRKLIYDCLI